MDHQESFLNYVKYEKRFSAHTWVAYKNDLGQFVLYSREMTGDFDVKNVHSKLVRGWVVALMEKGLTPRTVNRKISTLHSFFKYLQREKVVDENPVTFIPVPKIRKKLPWFVEEKNLAHLLDDGFFGEDFSGRRDKLIIALLYGTGIRRAELLDLQISDINRKECQIKVRGKRNKERMIPYPRPLNTILEDYLHSREETFGGSHGTLVLTNRGARAYPQLVYRVVKKNLDKVTTLEKKSPHVLRHTYATHLLNRGADLNAVKELLGHANLAATQIYTHTTFEKLQKVYKQTHPRG
jgi:integrase/recombinase XerC